LGVHHQDGDDGGVCGAQDARALAAVLPAVRPAEGERSGRDLAVRPGGAGQSVSGDRLPGVSAGVGTTEARFITVISCSVREYFSLCRKFWLPEFADPKLNEWESDIAAGRQPRGGPHLSY